MTQVATTLRSAYLAGPMRGIEEYNFPEFRKQTAWLRGLGWHVFSPAERDEQDPDIDHTENIAGWSGGRKLDYFMAHDLKAVCEMDCVILLPGWEESQGARLEAVVAVEIGHPVFVIALVDGARRLEHVDQAYIREVFFGQGPPDILVQFVGAQEPVFACLGDSCGDYPCGCDQGAEQLPTQRYTETYKAAEWYPWEEDSGDGGEVIGHRVEGTKPLTALPNDSAGRKAVPLASGVLDYFPAALAEVARVSKAGNDKHNPGQPLHHARGKSTDHADSLLRHLVDRGGIDPETGMRHSGEVAWRALALLQQELEDEGLAPLPRGAWEEGGHGEA